MSSDKNTADRPVCLAIGGLDPSGGAGIIADTYAIRASGCKPAAAITSVTFQNAQRVAGFEHISADSLRRQIMSVVEGENIFAVKTGMLPTRAIVETTAQFIVENDLPNLVIDPVLRSTSGYELIESEALTAALDDLLPHARLITPNVPEVEQMTGISIETPEDIAAAAGVLHQMGAKAVLVKGGHMPVTMCQNGTGPRMIRDHLWVQGELTVFESEYVPGANVRGTGCMLASSIAAHLAAGSSLPDAVRTARSFVHETILAQTNR